VVVVDGRRGGGDRGDIINSGDLTVCPLLPHRHPTDCWPLGDIPTIAPHNEQAHTTTHHPTHFASAWKAKWMRVSGSVTWTWSSSKGIMS
jgi:hypothetical protein